MALESLNGPTPPPEPANAEPSPASPEGTAEPSPEPAAADPNAEPVAPAEGGDEPLGEGGLRALQAERQAAKEARAELKALREEFEALKKAQAQPGQPPAGQPEAPDAVAAQSPSPASAPLSGPLEDCHTFEAVDARVMGAATAEVRALRLQNLLNRDPEAVREALVKDQVKQVGNVPLAEASTEQIGDWLANVYEGSRLVQAGADARKRFLVGQAQSFERAVRTLPTLKDAQSAERKAFDQVLRQTPWIVRQGPDWPEVVARQVLGAQQWNAMQKTNPPASTAKPAVPAAPRSAPGAPTRNAGAMPKPDRQAALQQKFADGTATVEEMSEYAFAHLK
jgi:hypothetical protein